MFAGVVHLARAHVGAPPCVSGLVSFFMAPLFFSYFPTSKALGLRGSVEATVAAGRSILRVSPHTCRLCCCHETGRCSQTPLARLSGQTASHAATIIWKKSFF
ncbi:hypothetical protein [Pandoravirus japonicus]|uniref:Uncharacterized protein n=1 Tax=Pandoravirus japonicus TaxID=2823154 RepID=A0A811BPF7_9VIRU|nr:hypothetical protein [Pandoravirus japonicus]